VDNGFSSASLSQSIAVSPSRGVSYPSIVSTVTCGSSCHLYGTTTTPTLFNPVSGGGSAPPWDNVNTADLVTLYQRIMQRVIVGSSASHLLTCPLSGCGLMGAQGWSTLSPPYTDVLKWIQDGAPPGN